MWRKWWGVVQPLTEVNTHIHVHVTLPSSLPPSLSHPPSLLSLAQLQPNSAAGSGALEHDPSSTFLNSTEVRAPLLLHIVVTLPHFTSPPGYHHAWSSATRSSCNWCCHYPLWTIISIGLCQAHEATPYSFQGVHQASTLVQATGYAHQHIHSLPSSIKGTSDQCAPHIALMVTHEGTGWS